MSNLFGPPPTKLRAITINGCIVVESDNDVKRREERRKNKKSRWEKTADIVQPSILMTEPCSSASKFPNLTVNSVKDNPQLQTTIREQRQMLQPTLDARHMDEKSQKIYLLNLKIQDSSRNLAKPDLGIPSDHRERSPSPEPVYNHEGVRVNTRVERTRARLISERNAAIAQLTELDPTYKPPAAFKFKNDKLEERVLIPAEEHPDKNFIGLILGPRGNHLEELKKETKCNIVIKGKGSLRSGMTGITKSGKVFDGLEDPLHVHISGSTVEDVSNAATRIQSLMDLHIYNPDSEEAVALRSKHMHSLAMLNGTLKEIDLKCLNCGRFGHKSWDCDERTNFTSAVLCSACGGVGHVTLDCKQRRPGTIFTKTASSVKPEVIDKEYASFVSDLLGNTITEESGPSKLESSDPSQLSIGSNSTPLMLTNGSAAPGAASAFVRSVTNPQQAGGALQAVGKSIFGGKMTKMTSGYKTRVEIEMENEKRKQEYDQRPVPVEWQVERFEKSVNKSMENYYEQLERQRSLEKKAKLEGLSTSSLGLSLSFPPPPPPGNGPSLPDMDGLPTLIGRPFSGK